MTDKSYRVLGSGSLGYQLYDSETKEISFHPHRRGKLSYKAKKIIIGDYVTLDKDGMVSDVLDRENLLKRPRLSNVDMVYVLISAKEPDFSSYLLDKFLSLIDFSSLKSSIVITKADLLKKRAFNAMKKRMSMYEKIGFKVYFVNAHDEDQFDFKALRDSLQGQTSAFVGQTGVGKSSLLNSLDREYNRKVDALYVNSGRGRHTTKEVILLPYADGFLFDTPGFSDLELQEMKTLDLATYFPGFEPYYGTCFFKDCRHLEGSKGCKVLEAVENEELSDDSYENYLKIYDEVKVNDLWKKKL